MTTPNTDDLTANTWIESNAPSRLEEFVDKGQLPEPMLAAYNEIWKGISAASPQDEEPQVMSMDLEPGSDLSQLGAIVGTGISLTDESTDGTPGAAALRLYTMEPMAVETAVQYVGSAYGVSALDSGDVTVEVVHTGVIDAFPHRFRKRPAPGGISVGHVNISAGTLGCLAQGRSSPRNDRTLILSNNHVLADVNAGDVGDEIIQPGAADGGRSPADVVGYLERYVPINFGGTNEVDCATAWVDSDLVRKELLRMSGTTPMYFPISSVPVPASIGMTVGKTGRTTQLTSGRITAVGVNIRVNMGAGRIARFIDQIEIRGNTGNFSAGGDSGSVIWTWNEDRSPVGLLFAGGGGATFANPIEKVLNSLDIDLLT